MKEKLIKITKRIYGFFVLMAKDRVGVYTAQASFFIILSLFPFVLLLLNIFGLTPIIDENIITNAIKNYTPEIVRPLLLQIIKELYRHVSSTALSLSAIVAIWSASKGVLSVMFGLYEIYKLHQNRIYIISRIYSMVYTLLFVVSIFIAMVLLVFGNRLFHLAISLVPALEDISILTLILRYLGTFVILTVFFALIYRVANFRRANIRMVLPGALLSSLGWIIFSFAFSIYVDNFSNMSYIYGSLTAVIVLMFWIYFCIYIFFIGAEINKVLHPELELTSNEIDKDIN